MRASTGLTHIGSKPPSLIRRIKKAYILNQQKIVSSKFQNDKQIKKSQGLDAFDRSHSPRSRHLDWQ